MALDLIHDHKFSERRSCALVGISRSQYRYRSQKKEDPEVVGAILRIKEKHPYYGVPRVTATLRRSGVLANGKRVCRIMKTLNLLVNKKRKRNKVFLPKPISAPTAVAPGEVWAMDFVFDRLKNGDPFRCFTIVDIYSRETPGIYASKSMAAFTPVDFLEKLKSERSLPKHFIMDNGSEFANSVFAEWCTTNNIQMHFIDPGKPVQNAYVESFNGKFRQEFLSQNRFETIWAVNKALRSWINYYNQERPHSSLDYLTPEEFAHQETNVLDRKNNLLVLKTG